jgi:hypothetical protein
VWIGVRITCLARQIFPTLAAPSWGYENSDAGSRCDAVVLADPVVDRWHQPDGGSGMVGRLSIPPHRIAYLKGPLDRGEFVNATPEQRDQMIEMVRQLRWSIRADLVAEHREVLAGLMAMLPDDHLRAEEQQIVDGGQTVAGQYPREVAGG